ncbi:MAG TPA: 50S ribosomal protein L17 [Myxococcota bacterium]|nr:50S ribosomal protein L17 [Myxococcota bacterium]
MRHRVHVKKLSRTTAHRLAMYRNLVTSLLEHEQVETTDVKAKEVRRLADRMITLGKRGDLHARRRALRVIRSRDVAEKVFSELADRFRTRAGGYTRVMKTRYRVGDAAPMSIVALLGAGEGAAAAPAGEKPAARKRGEKGAGAAKKAAAKAEKKAAAKKAAPAKSAGKKSAKGGAGAGKAAPRAKSKSTRSKKGS